MYLLYYTVSRMLLPEGWFQRLAWVTVWTSLIVSLHGLIEKLSMRQLLLPDVWKYKTLSATNFVRIYGLPGNPNSLALLLLFGILAVLFLQSIYKNEKYRWFLTINLVLFLGVFILTYSRGTWISAFILRCDFHFTVEKLASAETTCDCWSGFDYHSFIIPVNFGCTVFQTLGLDKHLQPDQEVSVNVSGRRSMKRTWRS